MEIRKIYENIYVDTVRDNRYSYGVINGKKSTKRQRSPDQIGDEALVEAYRQGDREALDILFRRYLAPIKFYLLKFSWFKSEAHLDDIIQIAFQTMLEEIRMDKFQPRGPGSFKSWAYTVVQNACRTKNRDEVAQPKTISALYPSEPTQMPDDLRFRLPPGATDYRQVTPKLNKALKHFTPKEQKLMRLVFCEGKKYKEIQSDPDFAKYSLDYLMLKVYNIRKKGKGLGESGKGGKR